MKETSVFKIWRNKFDKFFYIPKMENMIGNRIIAWLEYALFVLNVTLCYNNNMVLHYGFKWQMQLG